MNYVSAERLSRALTDQPASLEFAMATRSAFRGRLGFTLVELLVVIGILAVLIGLLAPALSVARQASLRTKCLAQLRNLTIAQAAYAAAQKGLLVNADSGSFNVQGSWIGLLEPYAGSALARRCPADQSPFFEEPVPGTTPPTPRMTSYAINNYVSPTHAPQGVPPVVKISQVRNASLIVQFVELAERGDYAGADHIHVQDFYFAPAPQLAPGLIGKQLPVGRHGGKPAGWGSLLNYAFLDGHAEALPLQTVYTDPTKNRFDPAVVN